MTESNDRKGVALLVVLFVVMAITVISLGFLSRSDAELACGRNMLLRTQMDQLADSGLQHAKGLILQPQDLASEYWLGAIQQQLMADSDDYYDVNVVRDSTDPNDRCTYQITCEAYRQRDGQRVGRSFLSAELRLDPCIALWTGVNTVLRPNQVLYGDFYCAGNVTNLGAIHGDVFCGALAGAIGGSHEATADLSLTWPDVTMGYFNWDYLTGIIGPGIIGAGTYQSARVWRCEGDLILSDDVTIHGVLLVKGNLIIRGDRNRILAAKNLPALYVDGDLIVEQIDDLRIEGLAVVDGAVRISAGASRVRILGGLFVETTLTETAVDSAGGHRDLPVHGVPQWRPRDGRIGGALEFDGVDDRLEDPGAGAYLNGLTALTVSLWVKSDVVGEDRGIVYVRDPNGADTCLGLRYDRVGVNLAQRCIKAAIRTTEGYTQIESSADVQTTSWQHLALVWTSGESLELYIDGTRDSLSDDGETLSGSVDGVQNLTLGRGAYGCYWDGLIDDVRIYNYALDPNTIPPPDGLGGLIGHWALDEDGSDVTITADPARSAIVIGSTLGSPAYWGPATDAFFRRIDRQ